MRKCFVALNFLLIFSVIEAQQPQPAPATSATPSTSGEQLAVPPPTPNPSAVPTTQAPPSDTLLDGTPVKLRLSQTISSADTKVGQEIPFEVIEDISVNNVIVLTKGSTAIATVTDAEHKKSMGRGGKLNIAISYARLKDQEKVALRATQDNKGGGHVGAMTGAMVATAVVFFPAAPLFLFIKGKDITIPAGTGITAFVQGDMHLNMANFVPPPPAAPVVAQLPVVQASLGIDSTPPGADIEIDGSFVGNTPSTVSVTPGNHQVAVKKKGFTEWARTLNVSGGNVRLNAELEQAPTETVMP